VPIKPEWRISVIAVLLLLAACGGGKVPMKIAEESPKDNEGAVTRDLIALAKQATIAARDEALEDDPSARQVLRYNQPTGVACLRADFTVERDLPPKLQVGLFANPRTYPAWIRFANATSGPDTKKDFRGMSIKLMGAKGPKLFGSDDTFDFLLNSHPVLFVGNPEDFRDFADRNLNSSPLLFFLNPFSPHIKELRIVLAGRRHHASHLTIPYWSTTPYLFGEGNAVKYSARPCERNGDGILPKKLNDGYLLDAVRRQMAAGGACFDFLVQFQTDPERMPVEDATVEWDTAESPFLKVASIDIPAQTFESPAQMEFCENLAFNPWHSLPEHRPLGGLNRVRKDLYQAMANFRHQQNGVTYTEPTGNERL